MRITKEQIQTIFNDKDKNGSRERVRIVTVMALAAATGVLTAESAGNHQFAEAITKVTLALPFEAIRQMVIGSSRD